MPSSSKTLTFRAYVLVTALVWAGTYLLVFTFNCLVDPLWYFQGNQLADRNFAFNERQAKLNQLLRASGQYDCLIFGSSRTTLLPASAFKGYRCYNLSFSGGQIEDFVAFAEYMHHVGMRPKLLIVGVDGFNFLSTGRDAPNIPDYVLKKQAPPEFLKTYLSIDSLRMSWRTVWGQSPLPRYYDGHFEAMIRSDAPPFRPEKSLLGEGRRRTDADARRKRGYRPDNAALYKKLISVFPEARAMGYVPPISAWHISDMEKNGVLSGYISALSNTAPAFSAFIDFSVPSLVTSRTDITYDGSHYQPSINLLIVRALQSNTSPDWGVSLKQMGFIGLAQRYQMALNAFRLHEASRRPTQAQHD